MCKISSSLHSETAGGTDSLRWLEWAHFGVAPQSLQRTKANEGARLGIVGKQSKYGVTWSPSPPHKGLARALLITCLRQLKALNDCSVNGMAREHRSTANTPPNHRGRRIACQQCRQAKVRSSRLSYFNMDSNQNRCRSGVSCHQAAQPHVLGAGEWHKTVR